MHAAADAPADPRVIDPTAELLPCLHPVHAAVQTAGADPGPHLIVAVCDAVTVHNVVLPVVVADLGPVNVDVVEPVDVDVDVAASPAGARPTPERTDDRCPAREGHAGEQRAADLRANWRRIIDRRVGRVGPGAVDHRGVVHWRVNLAHRGFWCRWADGGLWAVVIPIWVALLGSYLLWIALSHLLVPCLPEDLQVQQVLTEPDRIIILAEPKPSASLCPLCGHSSERVHSRYLRSLADLPWQGQIATLRLCVRRFRCDTQTCPRRIFTERLPTITAPRARRTRRLGDIQRHIGLALGGQHGARLARRLAMPSARRRCST
jgi:zinc-finger of transposase IS204/IS1001/IS1096/IS1165